MTKRPNLVFVLADQLRAASLPLYGEKQIETPHLDRLAAGGIVLDHCISTSPVCTPYRSMLLTGRHPQTTGHIHNSIRTRHTEISIADAFAHAGYRTGWVGKWHLHTGNWPSNWATYWDRARCTAIGTTANAAWCGTRTARSATLRGSRTGRCLPEDLTGT